MLDVLLVEANPTDAALAGIAIALRKPRARVSEARTLTDALPILCNGNAPRLAIFGFEALKQTPGKLQGSCSIVIGFAPQLSAAERQCALDAGVRAIYERPVEWRAFCDALERMLNDWLR